LAATVTSPVIDLGVLVPGADGDDNTQPAIRNALDFVGVPLDRDVEKIIRVHPRALATIPPR